MNVLIASSEIVPFAKTGGLADVTGALPKALRRIGVEADCVLPLYRCVDRDRFPFTGPGQAIVVPLGNREEEGSVEETVAGGGVRAFLVRNDRYFDREFLYGTRDGDYVDNSERFTFFCRAVMEWIARSGRRYDIIHCNDWQTALLPVYVKTLYAGRRAVCQSLQWMMSSAPGGAAEEGEPLGVVDVVAVAGAVEELPVEVPVVADEKGRHAAPRVRLLHGPRLLQVPQGDADPLPLSP